MMERDGHCFHTVTEAGSMMVLVFSSQCSMHPHASRLRETLEGILGVWLVHISVVSPNVDVFSLRSSYSVTCMYQPVQLTRSPNNVFQRSLFALLCCSP